jgi:general secretion pathway protein G
VNSDYDLYRSGKDGASQPPLSPQASRDDIVRAQNGAYMGLASEY